VYAVPAQRSRHKSRVKHAISSPGAPKAIGPYSPAIRAGQLLFVSGQVPIDPATGNMITGGIADQTRRVLDNIGELLLAAGRSFGDVARTTVFLADMNDFSAMNEVYGEYFAEPYPARATVQVARLPKDARVEIDVIAIYE
jgi:2-iminobutanoate/2-iminopropanoate deaminase